MDLINFALCDDYEPMRTKSGRFCLKSDMFGYHTGSG